MPPVTASFEHGADGSTRAQNKAANAMSETMAMRAAAIFSLSLARNIARSLWAVDIRDVRWPAHASSATGP